mgnify:CR=1 FL=1
MVKLESNSYNLSQKILFFKGNRMISIADLIDLVKTAVPDAEVNVLDKTGMKDHFIIHVTSATFADLGIMDRHRKVQDALNPAMQDGRIHAAEIKTAIP